jgi:DTW domain-containing protein YfiP
VQVVPPEPRALCPRCKRPPRVCYCEALPRLETRTRIVILQHPREKDMPIGTARMAQLALPSAELHVGIQWGAQAAFMRAISDPARPAVLLSPGPTAKDILKDPPIGPVTLVVVDGTWSQAKSVVRDNPCLQDLPRYAFASPEPSQYRIRKEPKVEYVSTIEALMHVLGVLEGDPAKFRALLDPLNTMVDKQLAAQRSAPQRSSYRKPRVASKRRLPELFLQRYADLVCVAAEPNAWPYNGVADRMPDEVAHFTAHRVATGETFDAIVKPTHGLAPATSYHLKLPPEAFAHGIPHAEMVAAYATFARPTDVVCTWGTHGLNLATAAGLALGADRLDLRACAQRLLHEKFGALETLLERYGGAQPTTEPGRARQRLTMLVQLAKAWQPAQSASGAATP